MIEPLQLDYWFVNVLAGHWMVFLFLAMAFIAAMSARFRMSNSSFGIMMLVFSLFSAIYFEWLIVLGILITGIIVFSLTTRWVR